MANTNTPTEIKDAISVPRLLKLHPKVQATFRSFIIAAETELGITLRITQGLRTIAEQNALYAQGRTTKGSIVTNAKGGQSYHNFGMAIDVVPMVAGKPDWNYNYKLLQPIAARFGIEWGGNFKSIVDKPHFQITFGKKVSELAKMETKDGYVVL